MNRDYKSTNFLGHEIVITPRDELLKNIISQVESKKKLKIVFTPNPEQLVYAKSHSAFANILGKADILIPDGIGIVIGSWILSAFGKGERVPQRISGVDLVTQLLQVWQDKKILVVGGRDYDNLEFGNWKAVSLNRAIGQKQGKKRHSLFWHEGFLNASVPTKLEKNNLLSEIKKLQPDVIFVALGAPNQEKWVVENKEVLEEAGVSLVMVVGGAFDMILGKVARAPKWIQRIGLEWFFRLYKEPWRWRRQLNLLAFIKMVVQAVIT